MVILSFGCAHRSAKLVPDLSFLRPFSPEYARQANVRAPFLAHYKKNNKQLYYVGSLHESSTDAPTFQSIKSLLGKVKFDVVIVEGFPTDEGLSPAARLEQFKQTSDGGHYKFGEVAFTALLANSLGTPFQGGEPSTLQLKGRLLGQGYEISDVLGHDVVTMIGQWTFDGTRKAKGFKFEVAFEDYVKKVKARNGVEPSYSYTLSDFKRWYKHRQGIDFEFEKISPKDIMPTESGTFIQRFSVAETRIRDTNIVEVIAKMLNTYDVVLIVYGQGHYWMEKAVLDQMLGDPVSLTMP